MNKEDFVYLTNNLYRLTLLFPKKEPLRYKIRELGNEILADSILILNGGLHKSKNLLPEIENNLQIINSFFEVAKDQNWVSPVNILAIQEQYAKLCEEFQRIIAEKKEEKADCANLKDSLPDEFRPQLLLQRQQRILELLRDRGRAQVWEVKQVFPEVTKRTLRRDFERLLTQGLIKRMGERNGTFYRLKS